MDGVRVDGLQRSIHTAEVRLLVSREEKGEGSSACSVYKLVIMALNWQMDAELWWNIVSARLQRRWAQKVNSRDKKQILEIIEI